MENKRSLQSIPDEELLRHLVELTSQSRRVEVDIVAHLAEVDERKAYARTAFPSLFVYCRDTLHLSEQEAYLRIAVARASREHPMLLAMLADGRLHLTAITRLAPHLTAENRDGLLERAAHRTKRQLEELIAEIAPRPDAPAVVRKLPERTTGSPAGHLEPAPDPTLPLGPDLVATPEPGAPCGNVRVRPDAFALPGPVGATSAPTSPPSVMASRVSPSVVQPLSPGRYKVQFTATGEFLRKLERLRALMGFRAQDGDLAAVLEQAVTEKLERLEARRFARTTTPRKGRERSQVDSPSSPPIHLEKRQGTDSSPASRHIPAAVRRAVYERDGGRCRFVDKQAGGVPSATGSNSTTATRSALAVNTASRTSV